MGEQNNKLHLNVQMNNDNNNSKIEKKALGTGTNLSWNTIRCYYSVAHGQVTSG